MIRHTLPSVLLTFAIACDVVAVSKVAYRGRMFYIHDNVVLGVSDNSEPDDNDVFALSDFYNVKTVAMSDSLAAVIRYQAKRTTDSVAPLLGEITFNQSYPYNLHAPSIGPTRCPAGCVAVAMAQIMMYYQKPTTPCHGNISYKSNTVGITIRDTFDGWVPDWANILPIYEPGEYNEVQANAVADLCRKLGAAVEMDYNRTGSGTQSVRVPYVMRDNFNYDADDIRSKVGDREWNELLISNLKAGHPVYYASLDADQGGHAYVCDGFYTKEGEEAYPYYHFNWGWGGKSNGWFRLNGLIIDETGDEFGGGRMNFNSNQQAIFNMTPKSETSLFDASVFGYEAEKGPQSMNNGNYVKFLGGGYDGMGNKISSVTDGIIGIIIRSFVIENIGDNVFIGFVPFPPIKRYVSFICETCPGMPQSLSLIMANSP